MNTHNFSTSRTIVLCITLPAALLVGSLALTGCQSDNVVAKTPAPTNQQQSSDTSTSNGVSGIAAKLSDGYQISEQDIANYIAQYRLYNGVTDDKKWATFLDESGQTVESIRKEAAEKLALDHAVQKEADEKDVTISDEELSEQLELVKKAALTSSSGSWSDTLKTAGYQSEDAYKNDLKLKLLKDKLANNNASITEPSDSQMTTMANKNVSKYTGKKLVEIVFPANSITAAKNVLNSIGSSTSEDAFREAGNEAVDSGAATKIDDTGWTCLRNDDSSVSSAVENSKVGDVVMYDCQDGTKRIAFVAEDYHATNKGTIVLNDMPNEIKDKLKTDTSVSMLDNQRTAYLEKLLDNVNVQMNDMPDGLPYYVDLSDSEYGSQTTREQDEQETKNLVEEQMNALNEAGNEQREANANNQ